MQRLNIFIKSNIIKSIKNKKDLNKSTKIISTLINVCFNDLFGHDSMRTNYKFTIDLFYYLIYIIHNKCDVDSSSDDYLNKLRSVLRKIYCDVQHKNIKPNNSKTTLVKINYIFNKHYVKMMDNSGDVTNEKNNSDSESNSESDSDDDIDDILEEYFTTKLRKRKSGERSDTLRNIYLHYEKWHSLNHDDDNICSKKELKQFLIDKGHKYQHNRMRNLKIIKNEPIEYNKNHVNSMDVQYAGIPIIPKVDVVY